MYRSYLLHDWILENHAFLGNDILDLVIEIENTGFSPMEDFDFTDHMKRSRWDYINADIFGRIYMRYLRELEIFQYFPKTTNVELLKVILKLAKLSHSDIIGLLRNNYFIMTPEVKKLLIDKYDPYDAPLSFFNIRREIDNVKNDKIEGWCTVD